MGHQRRRSNTGADRARVALKQWLYPCDSIRRRPQPSRSDTVTYRCLDSSASRIRHPFGNEQPNGWIQLSNGHQDFYLALGGTRFDAIDLETGPHHAPLPDAALLTEMFQPLPDHAGLDRTGYFERSFKRQIHSRGALVIECYCEAGVG
jgi:hypothetical protein